MSVSLLVELRESKLRCAVNRDKQVKFAFFSAHSAISMWKYPIGYRLNAFLRPVSPSIAGSLLIRNSRCSDESLYSSSDGVRGLGAAVKKLSHWASRNVASAWLIPRHSGTAHCASSAKNSDENQVAATPCKAKTKTREQGKSDQLS
jgi:hypothetical protein